MELKISSEENDKPPSSGHTASEPMAATHEISSQASLTYSNPELRKFSPRTDSKNHNSSSLHSQNGNGKAIQSNTFVEGERTSAFRRQFYPDVPDEQWHNWHWQLRSRIKDLAGLERILELSESERSAIQQHSGPLPVGITPYYASLLDPHDPQQPLRRTVVSVTDEYQFSPEEAADPLGEDGHSPVPGIVHRYPDRVLFLVTEICAVYCRYCTRSRMVGQPDATARFNPMQWEKALQYLENTPTVRDVLLSGGDPLTLADSNLDWLLSRLRKIPHIELVRLGTKVPAVLPQRITPELTSILHKYHPLFISVHFTHPDELTPETALATSRLSDAGIPLGSQTVLLNGINDNVQTMTKLMQGLLKIRVRPYYLYQCDPVLGTSHFRTAVKKGLDMIQGLRGHTSGYAIPHYVIDAPRGGGKIPLLPEYVQGWDGDDVVLKNYEGNEYRYTDRYRNDSTDDSLPKNGTLPKNGSLPKNGRKH